MRKIGVSACGFELTEENFRKAKESGIDTFEVSMIWKMYPYINYGEISTFSKRHGIELWSYHLPFTPFEELDISSLDGDVRKNSVEYLSLLIKKGADIGIDKFVIHSSGEPIEEKRDERMKRATESLDKLADVASAQGGVIAVEDHPRTCLGNSSSEIKQLISVNSALKVCFDTNHLLNEDKYCVCGIS